MKKKIKRSAIIILLLFLAYTLCTAQGAIQFQAFIISRNPLVYTTSIEKSEFKDLDNKPLYRLKKSFPDYETGNFIGLFQYHRYFLYAHCPFWGF